MSPQKDLFQLVINHFGADQEDMRAAAAFLAGNIAVGNLSQFLPAIVKMVETDPKKVLACVACHERGISDLLPVDILVSKLFGYLGSDALVACTIGGCCRHSLGFAFRKFAERGRDNEECSRRMFGQIGYHTPTRFCSRLWPLPRRVRFWATMNVLNVHKVFHFLSDVDYL
jgi:hypothetical protein